MGGTFRFIHAADIHLGSFLNISGNPQEKIQQLCKSAVYDGFHSLCSKAILYKVDFILLCGDVYDSYLRSVRGNRFFINQCERLAKENISVYVIYGNHDAINEKEELFIMPKNVHILSSDKVDSFEVSKEGEVVAKIIGKSYKRRNEREKIYEDYLVHNDVFNIAMLHTALEGNNKNYVPCTLEDIKNIPNIDYWALGHIHKCSILSDKNPIIAFPGIPQGRDMGEQGLGGAFLIEVCNKEINTMEFIPIATVVYEKLEITLEESQENRLEHYNDLLQIILEKLNGLSDNLPKAPSEIPYSQENFKSDFKGYVIQLVIKGKTSFHHTLNNMKEEDYRELLDNINEETACGEYFVWADSLVFRTSAPLQDLETLKNENSIFQDLEEIIKLYSEDEEYKKQLIKTWGAIWKEQIYTENIEEDKFTYDDEILQDIIIQAKELVVEKLVEALEIN